jgi:hypothetical protein
MGLLLDGRQLCFLELGLHAQSRIDEKRDEKRDIPVKNGISQIRTDKRSIVFSPAPV